MDNSLETKKPPPKRGTDAPSKGKPKTILIDKKLKIKDLHHTATDRASGPTTKPNPKPRIASAKGRVKPLTRLLRCATALRVTAPLGYGSRRLVSGRQGGWYVRKVPFRPVHTARPPLSLVNNASLQISLEQSGARSDEADP